MIDILRIISWMDITFLSFFELACLMGRLNVEMNVADICLYPMN